MESVLFDDQPIAVLGNTGFHRLMELLKPRYALPSRHYISDSPLPKLYNKVSDHLCVFLFIFIRCVIGLTTDIWSSDACPVSLLSPAAHWIDSTVDLKQELLHAHHFRGSHTAEHENQKIEEMNTGKKKTSKGFM